MSLLKSFLRESYYVGVAYLFTVKVSILYCSSLINNDTYVINMYMLS